MVFYAQIYRNGGWVYEGKDLEHAETVLPVEHRGGHFTFTKVTSPLGSRAAMRWGSSPHARTITEPTVDTIIDCRFVIFMREAAVIPRLFHLEMHPFIY